MTHKSLILCLGCMPGLFFGCEESETERTVPTTPRSSAREYEKYEGPIKSISAKEHPYRVKREQMGSRDLETGIYKLDDEGIPLLLIGKKYPVYHPVFLAQYGLNSLEMYHTTGDEDYLDLARRIGDKLPETALKQDGKMWFPYTFKFDLHGYDDQTMKAPWYSAMAQGQVLSLYAALNEIEPREEYVEISDRIFRTLLPESDLEAEPWCTCISEDGLLWLEEYPMDPPNNTLNGMLFAIYGIYDYHQLTGSEEAEDVLRGSIATIKKTIPNFRIEDGYSHYCLSHPLIQDKGYHRIHTRQLEFLASITGDDEFLEMAARFKADGLVADEHDD
jgi:hypothetical protein